MRPTRGTPLLLLAASVLGRTTGDEWLPQVGMAIKWAQGPTSLRIFCKFGARHDEPGEKNLKIRHIDVSMGGWAPSDPNKQWLTKRVGIRAKGEDAIYQLDLPLFRKIAAGNSTWERKPEGIVLTLDKAQWGGAKWPRLQRKDVRVPRSQHLWYNEQGDMDLEWDEYMNYEFNWIAALDHKCEACRLTAEAALLRPELMRFYAQTAPPIGSSMETGDLGDMDMSAQYNETVADLVRETCDTLHPLIDPSRTETKFRIKGFSQRDGWRRSDGVTASEEMARACRAVVAQPHAVGILSEAAAAVHSTLAFRPQVPRDVQSVGANLPMLMLNIHNRVCTGYGLGLCDQAKFEPDPHSCVACKMLADEMGARRARYDEIGRDDAAEILYATCIEMAWRFHEQSGAEAIVDVCEDMLDAHDEHLLNVMVEDDAEEVRYEVRRLCGAAGGKGLGLCEKRKKKEKPKYHDGLTYANMAELRERREKAAASASPAKLKRSAPKRTGLEEMFPESF